MQYKRKEDYTLIKLDDLELETIVSALELTAERYRELADNKNPAISRIALEAFHEYYLLFKSMKDIKEE